MSEREQRYIQLCKTQIERKFSFGNGDGYTQRDLELLSNQIEEKTAVVISLSTLKRFWKEKYKQSPQLATLNALALVLDYGDWQAFKVANQVTLAPAKRIPKLTIALFISLGLIVLLTFWAVTRSGGTKISTGTFAAPG